VCFISYLLSTFEFIHKTFQTTKTITAVQTLDENNGESLNMCGSRGNTPWKYNKLISFINVKRFKLNLKKMKRPTTNTAMLFRKKVWYFWCTQDNRSSQSYIVSLIIQRCTDLEKRYAEEYLESEHERKRETNEARLKANSEKYIFYKFNSAIKCCLTQIDLLFVSCDNIFEIF
jgi:hypothetical protein